MAGFRDFLGEAKPLVDARVEEVARRKLRDEDLVRLLVRGKRLRAGLLMLVNEAVWRRRSGSALDLASAIELAHSASLIIDDMLDEDELRRGLPTVHLTEGHKRAMLDTVGILSLPYDLAVPFGDYYVQSLADTQRGMVTGVLKELLQMKPQLPASRLYDTIIVQKTGRPFGLAASWGYAAGENGHPRNVKVGREQWRKYGIHVGKAMQIADDIADLRSVVMDEKRSGFGSEVLLLRCVTAERLAQELFSDIRKLDLHIEKAKELWSSTGAQKSLNRRLEAEITAAEDCVAGSNLPDTRLREALLTAPREIAQMMLEEVSHPRSGGHIALPLEVSSTRLLEGF